VRRAPDGLQQLALRQLTTRHYRASEGVDDHQGTEVEEGKKILRESGVKLTTADDLTDAAKKIVAAVKQAT